MNFTFVLAFFLALVSASHAAKKDSAPMVLFIFREDCYNKFVSGDISDQECIKVTISKGIGFAIVAGSSILKLPQIIKIVSNGSVDGLAAMSQYIEVSSFLF
jgi:mannose-P-dolichol utilization defect protein 1